MGRLGTQLAAGIKYGTGKIQPVLDVGRKSGVPQQRAHFIAYGRYPAGKYTQFNGVQSCSPVCIQRVAIVPEAL
jgi:hypothetical protein